jgi:hypothetical protein
MNQARRVESSKLKLNEFWYPKVTRIEALEPFSKFDEVFFVYRLTDLERSQFHVQADNPGYVAIIE